MKHYVVLADWVVDDETGRKIVGVYHTLEEAKVAFKNRVENDDRRQAEENGYEVFCDRDTYFEAGISGRCNSDCLTVDIVEVEN